METQDLTLTQAARAVGLHVETMRRLAREGKIETYIVNPGSRRPHHRITPNALQAFRARGRRAAEPASPAHVADAPPGDAEPGTLSGAEMISRWKQAGVFDVWDDRKALIGPGKQYADSAEYVRALRERTPLRGRP